MSHFDEAADALRTTLEDNARDRLRMTPCECEHLAHFDKTVHTPNGNPAHWYGHKYCAWFIKPVSTPMGKFNVCQDCAKDCYHPNQFPTR